MLVAICLVFASPLAAFADEKEVYIGGFPAGFLLNTTTVEVVGICDILTADGVVSPARQSGIKSGDIIDKINEREINSASDLNDAIESPYKSYMMTVIRGEEIFQVSIEPVIERATGQKKLGMLVKDSLNGIGTVTYVDQAGGKFGSLGHPVTDNNQNLIGINGGSIYDCVIYGIKKGMRGNPGELKGTIENNYMVGVVSKNCECGIFGNISAEFDTSKLQTAKIGALNGVQPGKAYIYSTVNGNSPCKYEISIVKVDEGNKDNRNFVIKIDDERLIEATGGIVQGMSGSPIVQNGKLVGAVTHVFVNDPTRGYGIGIEKMLSSY